jgi:hypothetical protein
MNRPGDTVSGMMNGHQILAGYTIRYDPGAEIVLKIHGQIQMQSSTIPE